MDTKISRRAAMVGLAASSITLSVAPVWASQDTLANNVFKYGIASGDPDHTSVVLWTHVTTDKPVVPVKWMMAKDPAFKAIVKQGEASTSAERDYTVKVVADGLRAGETYFYRFETGGTVSPVGKTKTLPQGRLDKLGIALASCSNYAFGFFNAYDAIAKDTTIDFVLHTGDYIYEYGADGWGGDVAKKIGRVHAPAHEIVSLSDYRTRHAQYKSDPSSQSMHAAHPVIAIWDDHESANNPWIGGAQNHTPDTEGSWRRRRDASLRAYYEWMPIREPKAGHERQDYWRTLRFGDLATMVTLETRHTARAEQIDYRKYASLLNSAEQVEAFKRDILGAPDRRMLSLDMEADLSAGLKASVETGQPWRLIGNPMPIARMPVPDLLGLGILHQDAASNAEVPGAGGPLAWKGKWNLPLYTDTWDGYPAARERFYHQCKKAGAQDLLVLTGDSHSFWANQLFDGQGEPMGLEVGTAGITSPGDFVESGFDDEMARKLDRAFEDHTDEVLWTDNFHQGYVRLELTPEQTDVTYIAVSTVLDEQYSTVDLKRASIKKSGRSILFDGL